MVSLEKSTRCPAKLCRRIREKNYKGEQMKKIRSVRVSDSLWQKVKAKAKAEDKSVSEVITNALRDYVRP